MDFEKLNSELYTKAGHYRFAKKPTDFDKGYLKISNWVNDLCFFYIQKRNKQDKIDEVEFNKFIEAQKEKIEALKPSSYRDGLLKAVDDIN